MVGFPNFKWFIILAGAQVVLPLIQYIIGRRYAHVAMQFTNIQTIILVVLTLETTIIGNPSVICVDRFIAGMALTMFLSIISYNQALLLLVYFMVAIYNALRSYWWILEYDDLLRWFRYNLFFITSLTIVYIFSRSYMYGQRSKY